jgi:hypothetical protein
MAMVQTGMAFNTGLKFKEILEEVQSQAETKVDLNLRPADLRMAMNGNITRVSNIGRDGVPGSSLTDFAFNQLMGRLDIPTKFARRISPDLLAENVNYFLERAKPEDNWLVRTYGSQDEKYGPLIRGFLSSDYTKFDDDSFLEMIGKAIGSENDHRILMYNRDDHGLNLRIGFPDLMSDVGTLRDGRPDTHMVGFHVRNSEVGSGSVMVTPMVYRLVCTNGLMRWVSDGDTFRQRHVHLRESEMFNRVAESVVNAVKGGDKMIEEIASTKEMEVPNPLAAIKQLAENSKYTKKQTDAIVTAFHAEPGDTQFHVIQSMTRAARDLQGDARIDLEKDASKLLRKKLKPITEQENEVE